MSKRRNIGDIVKKKSNAGFCKEELTVKIVSDNPFSYGGCFLCSDSDCKEWANCEVIENNKLTEQYVYHISECEMEDPV